MKVVVVTGVNSSDTLTRDFPDWPDDADVVVGIWLGGRPVILKAPEGTEVQDLHYRHMKPPELLDAWTPEEFQADIDADWEKNRRARA